MAEGIMGLAPGMGAPAAPQQAPEELDPRNLQILMDATASMRPGEFEGQLDESIAQIDPALAQQIQADLSAVQLSPEMITILLDVVEGLLEVPQEYAERRMQVIEAGLPEEFLPEEFNLEYLSTLRYVLTHLTPQEAAPPVQGFRNGGPVSLKPIAQFLASQGRDGDTILAHINKSEAAMLKRMGGAGTINPVTGLREYFLKKAWKSVTGAVKKVGAVIKKVVAPVLKVTKKLLSNPIVRAAATVAAVVLSGGTATAVLGAGAAKTALGVAAGAAINSTAVNLLAGDKPGDAIKSGLMVGATTGAGAYFGGGMPLTTTTKDLAITNPFTGADTTLRGLGKGTVDALNPFGKSAPVSVTTGGAAAGGAGAPGASTFLGMTTPQLLTTAATIVPPILSYMGSKEPPPSPADLDIPGVGGPTGAELLEQDPEKYGVTVGDVTSTFADPVPENINVGGGGQEPSPIAGAPAPLPIAGEPPTQFAAPNVTMPGSEQYEQMFSGYDPTKDPMNPAYNPFAPPTPPVDPTSLTGGFDTTQGFAQGGIATLVPQGYSRGGSTRTGSQRTKGGSPGSAAATRAEDAYYKKLFGGTNHYATTASKPKSQQVLMQEANASRRATERANERSTGEKNVRINAMVGAAQKAAKEGRPFEVGNFYKQEHPEYFAAINNARSSNPTSFMTPAEVETFEMQRRAAKIAEDRKTFDLDQARLVELRNRDAQAIAEKARLEKELADFEQYKAGILGGTPGADDLIDKTGGARSPNVDSGATAPISPAPSIPISDVQDIAIGGSGAPTAPTTLNLPAFGGSPIPAADPFKLPDVQTQQAVFGPDGKKYDTPSAAIAAGVFNYSTSAPTTGGIGSLNPAPATNPIPSLTLDQNMFAPPTNVNVSPTKVPDMFANGGIAATAPYRFSSGSNPMQHYPRRTGPINGPGTGKSDSIPAMLSDGEFVFTAKAVRNMGGGSRLDGAKKMYKMMKMLERKS